MTEPRSNASVADEHELVITRVFDAPRELVFQAWTQPEHLARWSGPKGFTTHVYTIELRPGGVFHYCMRSPDGQDHWCKGVYREIVETKRIVYIDSFSDEKGNLVERPGFPRETQVTVTFAEKAGKTEVTVRHAGLVDRGELQGWTEGLDRLAKYLARA